jgi:hypothetical protein
VGDRAVGLDRGQPPGNRLEGMDRSRLPAPAPGTDRSQIQNRVANVDRAQIPNRGATDHQPQVPNFSAGADRSHLQHRNPGVPAVNRDNALRGAGNPLETRQQMDRGTASRAAMESRGSGAVRAAGQRRP